MEKALTLIFGIISIILLVLFYKDMLSKKKLAKIAMKEKLKEDKYKYEILIPYFIHQVEIAKTPMEIFILHLKIWGSGLHHKNFGPCKDGTFRTDDIMIMNPSNVYLYIPEISFTLSLPELEKQDEDGDVYKYGIKRYKNLLISNLKELRKNYE